MNPLKITYIQYLIIKNNINWTLSDYRNFFKATCNKKLYNFYKDKVTEYIENDGIELLKYIVLDGILLTNHGNYNLNKYFRVLGCIDVSNLYYYSRKICVGCKIKKPKAGLYDISLCVKCHDKAYSLN